MKEKINELIKTLESDKVEIHANSNVWEKNDEFEETLDFAIKTLKSILSVGQSEKGEMLWVAKRKKDNIIQDFSYPSLLDKEDLEKHYKKEINQGTIKLLQVKIIEINEEKS